MIWVFEDSSKVGLGGGQQVTLSVLRALRDQAVRLIDSSEMVWAAAKTENSQLSMTLVPFRGKSVRPMSAFSFPARELIHTPFQLARGVIRTWSLMRRECPDVLYCPTRKGFLLALLLRWVSRQRIRTVYHAHSVLPDELLPRIFVRIAAHSSDLIVCVSRHVLNQMRGKRILLPNPLHVDTPPLPRIARKRPVVGFVGSTLPWKGFDLFLEVARSFGHRYRFRVFTHDDPGELNAPVVVYSGLQAKEIYRRLDVLLICSRAPESFSLVALEACAFDVPVVFPRQPALVDLLVPGVSGELYERPTVTAVGECLERVMERRDAYHPREALDWARFDPKRFESSIRRVLLGC